MSPEQLHYNMEGSPRPKDNQVWDVKKLLEVSDHKFLNFSSENRMWLFVFIYSFIYLFL